MRRERTSWGGGINPVGGSSLMHAKHVCGACGHGHVGMRGQGGEQWYCSAVHSGLAGRCSQTVWCRRAAPA